MGAGGSAKERSSTRTHFNTDTDTDTNLFEKRRPLLRKRLVVSPATRDERDDGDGGPTRKCRKTNQKQTTHNMKKGG